MKKKKQNENRTAKILQVSLIIELLEAWLLLMSNWVLRVIINCSKSIDFRFH